MTSWKRDFASGMVVLGPILITIYVLLWLYGLAASLTPGAIIDASLLESVWLPSFISAEDVAEVLRVITTGVVFVILVFAVGYLMRTTVGGLFERGIDNVANRVPGVRVIYNASKMAAETALGEQNSLQTPVKLEVWDGLRMTAFKTGRVTEDGREVLFLPTSPNITTGFVIEVHSDRITELDENVEDALTRVLSAGFGDADGARGMNAGVPIDVVDDRGVSRERAEGNDD